MTTIDLFIAFYKAIAECDAPEGTQVDEALADFQKQYEDAVAGAVDHKLEILHVRDPDGACEHVIYLDGQITTLAVIEDIDAGRGWTREDWQARVDDLTNLSPGYSEGFRNVVLANLEEPPGSDHITD